MTERSGLKFRIQGIVQGVGFRPFVYAKATEFNLTGWVCNTSSGVEIELNGNPSNLDDFTIALKTDLPPLARIDHLHIEPCDPDNYTDFTIIPSQPRPGEYIPISPDTSICKDCLHELFDPADRRYRYPFINCTNCGPRFTIIQDIPYDRPKTTMAEFQLCEDCESEYKNPLDRRFHAQPVACPVCGPNVWFEMDGTKPVKNEEAIQKAREVIKNGGILAVKGLGGFHLACDASNPIAVETLRERKKRSQKPFALMVFSLEKARKFCKINQNEEVLLSGKEKPIVLLEQLDSNSVYEAVAPNQHSLGLMLPYTPLHYLLLEPEKEYPEILVMTSGNISEEPIAYQDQAAYEKLSNIADAWLMHNRPIHMRTDDSVIRIFRDQKYPLRRARGYTPDPLQFTENLPSILAVGGELKNTFCLSRDNYMFLSHHIGDMQNYETWVSFEKGIKHFKNLFRIKPEYITADMHPDYLASKFAHEHAKENQLPLIKVQHHHAHLAACLADNKWNKQDEKVIGFIFDGTGYGLDHTIWGGEVLIGNYSGFERAYHLDPFPLPGGEAAIHQTNRCAAGLLWHNRLLDKTIPVWQTFTPEEQNILITQLEKQINSPITSSMGRLFDAVSSIIDICHYASYEGQAAIDMEQRAAFHEQGFYPVEFEENRITIKSLLSALLEDIKNGIPSEILAARFHNSIVEMVLEAAKRIRVERKINTVALSGGVWQNMMLLEKSVSKLEENDFEVLIHKNIPANDGGIAVGQLLIAAATVKEGM